jgi:hypothetical protein
MGNIALFALIALLVGAWALAVWVTWRDGQSRVARIILLPKHAALVVRTLNFSSRLIPLADLEGFWFADLTPDPAEYHEPTLRVQVRGGLSITIDLEGNILDEESFKAIFRYEPTRTRSIQDKKDKSERKKRA